YKPDIIQTNAGDTLKYAVFSKKLYSWTTPIVCRNASVAGNYITSQIQRKFNSFLYRNVDLVISVSKASKKDLTNNFPFLKEKTQVIPIGLEERKDIEPMSLQPENVKHIVHVGGFSFEK